MSLTVDGPPRLSEPEHFNGTVGTSSTAVPASAGNTIFQVLVKNPRTNAFAETLEVSFDGGTNFFVLRRNDTLSAENLGDLTQIEIKGSTASVDYEIVLSRLA